MKAAIIYLTQNTIERKIYLKTSLYFLFRNFNQKYRYPVLILQDDYDETSKADVLLSVRLDFRSLIKFINIDPADFDLPDLDLERLKRVQSLPDPVIWWRDEKYRKMCRWWLVHFYKYVSDYDYIMRMDDDSIIEEEIPDYIEMASKEQLIYISNMVHYDCCVCCFGLKEFFESRYEKVDHLFDFVTVNFNSLIPSVQNLLKANNSPRAAEEKITLARPIMFFNNFHITSTSFWLQPKIRKIIKDLDKEGLIFYYRLGDAPVETLIVLLECPEKVKCFQFKYSKRIHREAFKDASGKFHNIMPVNYLSN